MNLRLSHVAFATGISRAFLLTCAVCLCFSAKSFGKAAEEYNCSGFDKEELNPKYTYKAVKFELSLLDWVGSPAEGDFTSQLIVMEGEPTRGGEDVVFDLINPASNKCKQTWEIMPIPESRNSAPDGWDVREVLFKYECTEEKDDSQVDYINRSHEFHAVCFASDMTNPNGEKF